MPTISESFTYHLEGEWGKKLFLLNFKLDRSMLQSKTLQGYSLCFYTYTVGLYSTLYTVGLCCEVFLYYAATLYVSILWGYSMFLYYGATLCFYTMGLLSMFLYYGATLYVSILWGYSLCFYTMGLLSMFLYYGATHSMLLCYYTVGLLSNK